MGLKKVSLILIVLLMVNVIAFSQVNVKANLNSTEYGIGDLVEVSVNVADNSGFHGMYFDLNYDSNLLEFDDVVKDTCIKTESKQNELLYAYSTGNNARVIVSWTLKGNGIITSANGNYVKLLFRVKNQGTTDQNYNFTFNNNNLIDGAGNIMTSAVWQNSPDFTIKSPYQNSFILIKQPYEYQVFYQDDIFVSLICSEGDYKVKLINFDYPDISNKTIDVSDGVLLSELFTIKDGFNRITAELYDNNNNMLARDTVKVYRSDNSKYIKIVEPINHSLINTDMVEIVVHSPYENVEVNGTLANYNGETVTQNSFSKVYKLNLWLKQGFNTITAVTKSPEGVIYKDTIDVYYQKDSTIFNFVMPRANEYLKSAQGSKLFIKGEIDSLYKTGDDPVTGGPVLNTVTLDATYYPNNEMFGLRTLVDNRLALIAESDYSYENATSKYVFYNNFDIPLDNLENGYIIISAYKNKDGNAYDDKITRIVYVDDNRLYIDLVQPNVFTNDSLDTYQKIKDFNESKDFNNNDMEISIDGGFVLKSTEREIKTETLKNVSSLIETEDGSQYALVNDAVNSKMKIYKKEFNENVWTLIVEKTNLYGYTLCKADIGILVGVSNMFNAAESEIYLLRDNNLINIEFNNEIIRDVQFITYKNNNVYLYGNYYDYLYKFDTYSLEDADGKIKVFSLTKINFKTNFNIKQFILTADLNTIALRTDTNDIYFYNKINNQYVLTNMPEVNDDEGIIKGNYIICGEFTSGDYNSFIIVKEDGSIENILENKNKNRFYRDADNIKTINALLSEENISLIGIGYKNNNFVFLYKKGEDYYVKRGQVFFGVFYMDSTATVEIYQSSGIGFINNNLYVTNSNALYYGYKDSGNYNLRYLLTKYKTNGSCDLNYVNDDIDGLTGFSFEINPVWSKIDNAITFGFSLKQKAGDMTAAADPVIFNFANMDIKEMLDEDTVIDNAFFKMSHSYENNREIIHFEFKELQKNKKYINYRIGLTSNGNASPSVYEMKIYKKIHPKICAKPGAEIKLPIHGYVHDRTVKEVIIQNIKVPLERNGSFYHDLIINSSLKLIPVEIYCTNQAGQTASLNFTVEVIDSINGIIEASSKRVEDADFSLLKKQVGAEDFVVNTTKEQISLKGKYFGLAGCALGYELYSYDNQENEYVLKTKGLFNKTLDPGVYDLTTLGSGYEAGYYEKNLISLLPGRQRLVIYCENPGGLRVEYKDAGLYPDIMYNLPNEDQEIIFNLNDDTLTNVFISNNVPIKNILPLDCYEVNGAPYQFVREYEISGYVKTLIELADLKVISYDTRLTFDNNTGEITIPVEAGNRFKIKIKVKLSGNDFINNLDFGVFPTKSFLSHLKKGVRIEAKKCFENTNFIPDFKVMDPVNWTNNEKENLIVPVRFTLNRDDVPSSFNTNNKGYIEAQILVNYQHEIKGEVYKKDNMYYIKDSSGSDMSLMSNMIKDGINRIQWTLAFKDKTGGTAKDYVMSYSTSGKDGMADHLFTYQKTTATQPTVIVFNPDLTDQYYNAAAFPELNIGKDISTECRVYITNGRTDSLIAVPEKTASIILNYNNFKSSIIEGKNTLIIEYTEYNKTKVVKTYDFKYDSLNPAVKIESYKFDSEYTKLLEITASVEEANYSEGFLYFGSDIVNKLPQIEIRSDNKYQLTWNNLDAFNIAPSALNPVKIEVKDQSNKNGFTELLTGFKEMPDRPVETDIKELNIDLPVYNDVPQLGNESNFTERSFAGHTKFGPDKLLKRVSIKNNLTNNEDYLIRSAKPLKADPIYWSRCESVANITTAPDIGNRLGIVNGITSYNPGIFNTGKYGNCLGFDSGTSSNTGNYCDWEPQGSSFSTPKQGAVSFWMRLNKNRNTVVSNLYINLGSFQVLANFGGASQRVQININGVTQVDYMKNTQQNVWYHVYIIWNEKKSLTNGKTVKVYINDELFAETDININVNWSYYDKFKIVWNDWWSSHTAGTDIDNLKLWDYVVSQDPNEINNIGATENYKTSEDFLKPAYYSKCESIANITTNPEVGAGIGAQLNLLIGDNGKFGKNVYFQTPSNTPAWWKIQGDNFTMPKKGTMSFWLNRMLGMGTRNALNLYMNAFRVSWQAEGVILNVNGISKTYNFLPEINNWSQYYIIWDENKNLNGGYSIKVFYGDTLILDSSDSLTWSTTIQTPQFEWWDDDSNNSTSFGIDNVKLWYHVVSETPDWLNDVEGNEEATTVEEAKPPVYWNKFENTTEITNPTLSSSTYISTLKTGDLVDGITSGKYGNCLGVSNSSAANAGEYTINFSFLDSGSISFWSLFNYTSGISAITLNLSSNTYIRLKHQIGVGWSHSIIVNGETVSTSSKSLNSLFHDIYIIWDNNGELSDNKSIRVFIDGIEEMRTTITYTVDKTTFVFGDLLTNYQCSILLDNLRVWDYIVSEDPETIAETETTSSLPEDYGKYIVFKIAKDYFVNNIITKEDIRDKIKFKFIGKRLNGSNEIVIVDQAPPANGTITYNNPFIFDQAGETEGEGYQYIEGTNHVYYIVKSDLIKSKFNAIKAAYAESGKELDPNGENVILDPGSLKIIYDYPNTFKPADVYIIGKKDPESGQPYNTLNDIIVYDPGYEAFSLVGDYTALRSEISYPVFEEDNSVNDRAFVNNKDSEELSINFWMRIEDEGLAEQAYSARQKRLFTFGDETTEYSHLSYNQANLNFVDGVNPVDTIGALLTGANAWNMITMVINKTDRTVKVYLNDGTVSKTYVLSEIAINNILKNGAKYYFGAKTSLENEQYNTGFYSVALPFYVNRSLTAEEMQRLYNLYDRGIGGGEIRYNFPDSASDFEAGKLKKTGVDYWTDKENAGYSDQTDQKSSGSLKTSGIHKNLLKIKNEDVDKNIVIFKSAESPVKNNLIVNANQYDWTISPEGVKGVYYFGDKNGNYGLGKDRYYTVTGEVINIGGNTEAKLVLRINNNEQFIKLKKGHFNFVYNNSLNITPNDVKLFIETNGSVTLSTDMSLNEGNYVVKTDMDKTYASTRFPFDLAGSVSFWYKPLNANKDGFVNYNAVLFDSEYIKIGTKTDSPESDAVYYAYIKNQSGGSAVQLDTNVKATHKWQFIQLVYNCDKDVVYFYIDGSVAAKSENSPLHEFGSLQGNVPDADNVYIGCNIDKTVLGEGYIDKFVLSKYYLENKYLDINPIDINYNQSNLTVGLSYTNQTQSNTVTNQFYKLESLDNDSGAEGGNFPIDLTAPDIDIKPGRYRLTTAMVLNNHNYKDITTFNINNKPKFNLISHTPVVFASVQNNITNNIKFGFNYDDSYRFKEDSLIYSGLAVKITYTENSIVKNKYIYLVQDYQNARHDKWLVGIPDSVNPDTINWSEINNDNYGLLTLTFSDISCVNDVDYKFKYFYFNNIFTNSNKFESMTAEPDVSNIIPVANINHEYAYYNVKEYDEDSKTEIIVPYEYKLIIKAFDNQGEINAESSEVLKNIEIGYKIKDLDNNLLRSNSKNLDESGALDLYYDDILPVYGKYKCDLTLKYNNIEYANLNDIPLNYKKQEGITSAADKITRLEIDEFSLIYIDKKNDSAKFYLKYSANNIGAIKSELNIIADGKIINTEIVNLSSIVNDSYIYGNISPVYIPKGSSIVKITLSYQGLQCSKEIELNNFMGAPDIMITNWVPSEISYNNVLFSWKGSYEGVFNDQIEYTYNFDKSGWTTPNNEWRSVIFYNLNEGYHSFSVKAIYNEIESDLRSVNFFVDVNRPVFDRSLIKVEKLYENGVLYAVKIIGMNNAITDASLRELYFSGAFGAGENAAYLTEVDVNTNGSFAINKVLLTKDGVNKIQLTAVDKVGNFTDYIVEVDNTITQIIFPDWTKNIKYCPMTIVGKINDNIDTDLSIYVRDPFCTDKQEGDYSGWKKAKINPDRTFFIEDVFVNPGTNAQEILTQLKLACVFDSGKVFDRDLNIYANEIIMPIEMTLSAHSVEGENADTIIDINCKANVPEISSWSIDYNGDGIYDDIKLTDNPKSESAKVMNWTHKYSSLGIVKPRVRIITTDGNFFSVSDTLIIHEKIKEASNKMIDNPISLGVVHMPDNSKRIFVLRKNMVLNEYLVEVYEVGRNETFISNKLFTINLTSLGLTGVLEKIRTLDKDHLIIAGNNNGFGVVYEIIANNFGNYELKHTVNLTKKLNDISNDKNNLFITYENSDIFTKVQIVDQQLNKDKVEDISPAIDNSHKINANSGIAKDLMGLLVSDYYNQRIVRLSNNLTAVNQYGSLGNGEKEFLKPEIIKSYDNRIFIYDEGRKDIQVFDLNFKSICRLEYNLVPEYHNYLEPEFFNDVADIEVITKVENNLLYYYALLLSKSTGKLAMLRLPQWEELRARTRNNKIVFIQDGEVFTAKPNASDLMKILSSDSIPRIEGNLDYPALSPDGRSLVFTSRLKLYNGEVNNNNTPLGVYDNVYVYDIERKDLIKIDLGNLNGYEIERPQFNSNGDKLIFSAKETGKKWQIYIYDFKDMSINKLFSSDENARFPYYSPDDRFVVFTTDYDGDEEIEIIDTTNTTIRVSVTNNYARDSLPVWSTVYPYEILNPELKIESKISFVSERNYHKGIYYVYIKRPSESDIRVVKKTGEEIGNKPDTAAIEITNTEVEGDYPCFTGDGTVAVFQYFDGTKEILKKKDFTVAENILNNMELPGESRKPAGMKNMIANFKADNKNGDEILLTWNRYTDNDIFYIVRFMKDEANAAFVEKKVFSQTGTLLKGLEMGQGYLVKVCIIENEEEVATSQWKKVKMPEVVARPSFEIDANNPYLVHLKAWKPEEKTEWNFSWIIDNNEINVQSAVSYTFEFATSGTKSIMLKASNKGGTVTNISSPMEVNIISDIQPVILCVIANDSSNIELSALSSKGKKIDFANIEWTITGPGNQQPLVRTGGLTNVDLTGFLHKIYVNIKLKRIPVNGQSATDMIEHNRVIDLDFKEVKPIITTSVSPLNKRLIVFSGEQSLGNVDWYRAKWTLYANNGIIYNAEGVSTFDYLFPETNEETIYTVSLTVPRRNDGKTETISQIVSVEPAPIEPVIDYQVLTLNNGQNVIGAKILLDCTKSKGSDIDYNNARWNVPIANNYGEQSIQTGPAALFNLIGLTDEVVIEVALTIGRKNGNDPITITKLVNLKKDEIPESKLVVTRNIETSTDGKTVILDVLKSSGPNIDWEKTEWLIDGQPYPKNGPVARIDVPASAEKREINYVCTLYRYGGIIQKDTGKINIDKNIIIPLISYRRLSASQPNVFELSVLDTKGINIDWERTDWYIYDGNENVVQVKGAKIAHAFALKSDQMGYPVMVEMYLKGSSKPFVYYTTIDVDGDELMPIISYDIEKDGDANTITFNAINSKGSNIDWSNAKWTFGDSSEAQYGSSAVHKFPIDSSNKTYRVALSLTRRSVNGSVETKIGYKDIVIGRDEIKAVIKAKKEGDYVVLSAEESLGRGLLLDRAVWTFTGDKNSESFTKATEDGKIQRNTILKTGKQYYSAGVDLSIGTKTDFTMTGPFTGYVTPQFYINAVANLNANASKETNESEYYEDVDSSKYKNFNETFTNSDSHIGAICRRLIVDKNGDKVKITITLFVYRMDADGGMQGESITVNVDPDDISGTKIF